MNQVSQLAREGRSDGVLQTVDSHRGGVSWVHQALLYSSEEEFLAGAVPFVRNGLECGDPVLIAATKRNTDWLCGALGVDAEPVRFCDSSQWYRHPMRALAALYRAAWTAAQNGQRLRMLGELVSLACSSPQAREWARYESLVNVAVADVDAALLCSYDTRVVDSDVMATVTRTHPELVFSGCPGCSPTYTDPVILNAEYNRSPLSELPPPTLWLRIRRAEQLVTLRAFVTSHAIQAGVDAPSIMRFVQAVNEVVTNVVEHGGGSGVLQIWAGPDAMVCEVSDTGTGLADPLAGYLFPSPDRARGRGLWFARQFSDLVEIRSDSSGTTVRLHLTLALYRAA
jgi:anti-sigma regulatory factor (Ser/Thr protein kinase)